MLQQQQPTLVEADPDQFAVGQTVMVETHSNLGVVVDTIRKIIWQETLATRGWAAILTEHSWAYLADCTPVQEVAR